MFRNPSRQPMPARIVRTRKKVTLDSDAAAPKVLKVTSKEINPDLFSTLEIVPLGAGAEVGRSCILLKFKGKNILLDCGIHPGYSGLISLPYFDSLVPEDLDLVLISHFHIDHAASLPYFYKNTTFKGRIFMTPPTKAICTLLLGDFVRISSKSGYEALYTSEDVRKTFEVVEEVAFREQKEIDGIKFTALPAGHILGAAMFLIEIAGVRILYTGDFSREEDRHLCAAEIPDVEPDIMIMESTYGVQRHNSRTVREYEFTQAISKCVTQGGKVLIPVFALGRSQELMLILEDYWAKNHEKLSKIPILFSSTIAVRALQVYQACIETMNDSIQRKFVTNNPWKFKYIQNMAPRPNNPEMQKYLNDSSHSNPCVVFASPGMLQSGMSREIFDRWCQHPHNTTCITGYSVDGTLAKKIMSQPRTIKRLDGAEVPLKCLVHYISFSAHSDYATTRDFVDLLEPTTLVLVHGERHEMNRLRQSLIDRYNLIPDDISQIDRAKLLKLKQQHQNSSSIVQKDIKHIFAPKNCQKVEIEFREMPTARILGNLSANVLDKSLKSMSLDENDEDQTENKYQFSGLLIRKDFNDWIIDPDQLSEFTKLTTTRIHQSIRVAFRQSWDVVLDIISILFIPQLDPKNPQKATIRNGAVSFAYIPFQSTQPSGIEIEWVSEPISDSIVDAIQNLLLMVECMPLLQLNLFEKKVDISNLFSFKQSSQRAKLFKLLTPFFGPSTCINPDLFTFQLKSTLITLTFSPKDGTPHLQVADSPDELITYCKSKFKRALSAITPIS